MRKLLLVLTAAVFAFGSCTKKDSTQVVYIEDTSHHHEEEMIDTSLTISGISDIRSGVWGEQFINITVNRNSGLERKVTMSISGLPENVKAEFSSISGYTSFNTILMLDVMFAKPGVYPLTISSTTDDGKKMNYDVNLTIDSPTKKECNDMLLDAILGSLSTEDVAKDSVVFTSTFIQLNFLENELYLNNVVLRYSDTASRYYRTFSTGNSFHVMLNFDCITGKLIIPEQEVEGRALGSANLETFKISGEGTLNVADGTYHINYITEYDDNGTTVISSLILKGALRS